jgi:hypothetical protein
MADKTKTALTTRIEMVERELTELRRKQANADITRPVTLRGIWKDIDITDEDIEEAEHSLFRDVDDI